ncbi:MAG: hypothetical protein JXA90_14355 [Planctomycetes bacterium]|nr:hypothetical protein [Planctomycetota bacterium]
MKRTQSLRAAAGSRAPVLALWLVLGLARTSESAEGGEPARPSGVLELRVVESRPAAAGGFLPCRVHLASASGAPVEAPGRPFFLGWIDERMERIRRGASAGRSEHRMTDAGQLEPVLAPHRDARRLFESFLETARSEEPAAAAPSGGGEEGGDGS